MKIKSLVDIITNSSSECYQIKNTQGITAEEFKEKWFNELVRQGVYDKDSSLATDTLLGDIYSEDDYLYLDYPVLCNIDFDILKVLKEWFGESNVEATW